MDHVGQGFAVLNRFGYIDDPSDVGTAVTDKDAYSRLFLRDIPFLRIDSFLGEVSPSVVKKLTDLGAGTAGAKDRFRDIDGTLQASAHEDPRPVGYHGVDRIELAEVVMIKFDTEFFRKILHRNRRSQSDG